MGVPFHYVDLRAFAYDTEDDERVERALRQYLPEDSEIERAESDGHYGSRILVLSARVENADQIRHVLDRVMDLDDIERVRRELEDRIDDNCSFYLHLDKQAAFAGRAALGPGITFRAKVEAYPAKRENALKNARDALSA